MSNGTQDESAAAAARASWIGLACAIALTLAVLGRSLGGGLVYDDLWLVARNPALASWEALQGGLGGAHWDFVEPDAALRIGYWRPLAVVALFVGRQIGGGEPWAFHALSLAFHALSVAFVFGLARAWLGSTRVLAATAAALVFGLHPVQVEAVSWISALNDPLAGCLVLGALLAFVRWRRRGSNGAPLAATACFAAALFAKESALAAVLLVPVADWLTRIEKRPLLRAYAPALVAIGVYWIARAQVFGDALAGFDRVTSYLHESASREFTLRVELLGGALALLAWPAKLNLFREVRPEIPWDDSQLWIAVGALALWLALLAISIARRQRLYTAALLFALAAFAPAALRYESIGRFPLSERFLYVSVLGVALAVACIVDRLPRAAAFAALGIATALCGARSFTRIPVWRDELALFRDGVEASPRSMYVHWGLGRVLLDRFQATNDVALLLEANDHFLAAQDLSLAHDPTVLDTLFDELQASLGVGWYHLFCALYIPQECTMDEAELVFRSLAAKAQSSAEVRCGLGVALRHLGRVEEAEAELKKGLEFNPKHQESWFNLGVISLEREKWSDALEQFQHAVELKPDDVASWLRLGMAAIELGLGDRARSALSRAQQLAPESLEPLLQLGVMAAREGRFEVALDFFERALKIDGSHGPAHLLRAKALQQLQRTVEATAEFLEASRWLQEPSSDPLRTRQTFEAFYNAGVLTLERSPKDALPMLEAALERDPEGRISPGLRQQVEMLRKALEKE